MKNYSYNEEIVKGSNIELRSILEQVVNSNICKCMNAEFQGGAFTIYLEFCNLTKESCANETKMFVKRFADLQKDCSSDWSYLWALYPVYSEGNIGATIIVFSTDDSFYRIIQKVESIQSILPEHKFLADVAIRISGLQSQFRKAWLMGQIPGNAELLDCGVFNHK